jgi:hypothetical protein
MSLAEEPQVLGSFGRIAERFADADERQFDLIRWMERNGYGSTPWGEIPDQVLERARRELGHPEPPRPPAPKTFAAPPQTDLEKRAALAPAPAPRTPPATPKPAKSLDVAAAEPRSAEPPPAPRAPVHAAPAPATPAEEERAMKRPCGCAATGRHKASCAEAGKSNEKVGIARGVAALRAERAAKASPAPAKTVRALPMARSEKPGASARARQDADAGLEEMRVPELQLERERCLARATAVTAELKRRRDELNDAIGEGGSTRSTGTEG